MPKLKVALAGDMHYGSAYCDKEAIKNFYKEAKAFGCKRVYQEGDIIEGQYRHHRPIDLEGHGFDEQTDILCEHLPDTLPTSFILGNHDETFDVIGLDVGKAISNKARRQKKRLTCHGSRRAFITTRNGFKICLFHPKFGSCKASTLGFSPVRLQPMSKLEKFLASVYHTDRPDIVAVGHWHQSSYFNYRGMAVFLGGCFQQPGGSFSNSLDTTPAVGSWLLDLERKKSGRVMVNPIWLGYPKHA